MSEHRKPKYIFFEKFLRELFENVRNADFLHINKMHSDFSNELRAIFFGTLLKFEDNTFLFTIMKQSILSILKSVLVDISTFQNYIDFHKYKRSIAENATIAFENKNLQVNGQKSNTLIETYKKWYELDYIKAKTELELVLIFIDKLGTMSEFYSFIECFENGMFLQY